MLIGFRTLKFICTPLCCIFCTIFILISVILVAEVINMAKAGMRRPGIEQPHGTESNHKNKMQKNDVEPVPEIQARQNQDITRQEEYKFKHLHQRCFFICKML